MSDFIVRFEGIELSEEQANGLQASIHKTVLEHVSSASLASREPLPGGQGPLLYFIPISWLGIIISPWRVIQEEPTKFDGVYTVSTENKQLR